MSVGKDASPGSDNGFGESRLWRRKPSEEKCMRLETADTSDSSFRKQIFTCFERIAALQQDLYRAKQQIRLLSAPHDSKPTGSKSKAVHSLWNSLWRAILSDNSLDRKYKKRDFLQRLEGKQLGKVEEILGVYISDCNMRELRKLVERFAIRNDFNAQRFVSVLKRYQTYCLFEDVEKWIHPFRMHFAVRDIPKCSLKRKFVDELPQNCSQRAAVAWMTGEGVALPQVAAQRLVSYIWRGRKKMDVQSVDFAEFPEWTLISTIRRKIRLEAALRDYGIEDVPARFSFPLTPENLQAGAIHEFALSAGEAETLCAFFFPLHCSSNLHTLSSFLSPPWKRKCDLSAFDLFSSIYRRISVNKALYQVAEVTNPSLSGRFLCLSEFLSEAERRLALVLTEEERTIVELSCYQDTKEVDAIRLDTFLSRLHGTQLLERENPRPVLLRESSDAQEPSSSTETP